ncbi:type II toxin-antitoxin system PemK/MazF family toxin [Streptosporangium sp. KLBMP 9127]|nr:type II toxin-antitoxin system PemK/MazF family toxin [Streptosporangium sp. KLBMP 9127]
MSRLRDLLRRLLFRRRPAAPPGQAGPHSTGPHSTGSAGRVGRVRVTYNPSTDGDPDPGEIVWTWVPFEEDRGRGKDRPVLIVAQETAGTLLAVQLSSRNHDGDPGWVAIGRGSWDGENRPSWVDTSRILRVHPDGMRREAAALGRAPFDKVAAALRARYGW